MNRRELFELLGWATGTVAISPVVRALDTDELERLARAIASPSRVDERVIDHLDAVLRHCKRQEDALGPRAVLNTVLAQQHLVSDLLAECPASFKARLLSVYSDMSSSIRFYFFNLNDFDSAGQPFGVESQFWASRRLLFGAESRSARSLGRVGLLGWISTGGRAGVGVSVATLMSLQLNVKRS
ncbi:MAG: hypothetical protein ACT4NY_22955 [Pseudonocardiales bacterium]